MCAREWFCAVFRERWPPYLALLKGTDGPRRAVCQFDMEHRHAAATRAAAGQPVALALLQCRHSARRGLPPGPTRSEQVPRRDRNIGRSRLPAAVVVEEDKEEEEGTAAEAGAEGETLCFRVAAAAAAVTPPPPPPLLLRALLE